MTILERIITGLFGGESEEFEQGRDGTWRSPAAHKTFELACDNGFDPSKHSSDVDDKAFQWVMDHRHEIGEWTG